MIDDKPKMVDPEHATTFDIRTKPNHKSSICTDGKCLHHDTTLFYSPHHSSKFLIIQNDDTTYTFILEDQCLSEHDTHISIEKCSKYNDRFIKIPIEPEITEKEYKKGDDGIIFNYGLEDTNHVRDSVIQMSKEDENFSLVPRNRHHNSHVHRVGGFADKAYYTYYSYHPSSRHSAHNFHGNHHGIPKSWGDEADVINL